MELLRPITSPSAFTSAPPELPGLIAASVWIMSKYACGPSAPATRLRPFPLITPTVTLGSGLPSMNPYGLPMAMAHSPTITPSELPSTATGRFWASILITATSCVSSTPMTVAG